VNQKNMREGKQRVRERENTGAEVADRVRRPVQAAESQSSSGARRSHRLTKSSSSQRSKRCVLRVENLLCSSTLLSIAEIVYFFVLVLIFLIFLL
jgi:hypothetical protein